jgi:hypothetical protein
MEGLAVAIQQREITYPEGVIVNELQSFEYVYTRTGVHYSAPTGLHDDCVMALGLAVEARKPGHEFPQFFFEQGVSMGLFMMRINGPGVPIPPDVELKHSFHWPHEKGGQALWVVLEADWFPQCPVCSTPPCAAFESVDAAREYAAIKEHVNATQPD